MPTKTITLKFSVGDIAYIKTDAERGVLVKAQVSEVIVNVMPHMHIARYRLDSAITQRETRWLEENLLTEEEAKTIAGAQLKKRADLMALAARDWTGP